jgi:hypothetical protein
VIRICAVIIIFGACAFTSCFAKEQTPDIKVTLTQNQKLEWRVRYDFKDPQVSMFFWRSGGDYRRSTWTALSKHTHLERINGLDTLWFDQPSKVAEFLLTPHTERIRSDYTPFLKFGDGGLGVYTGQFEVALTPSIEDIKALNGQTEAWSEEPISKTIELRSALQIVTDGKVNRGFVVDNFADGGIYIYVGNGKISQNEDFIGVIDQSMPSWVRAEFTSSLPVIFKTLAELYQYQREQRIELLYAFKDTKQSGFSNGGGTIGKHSLVIESSGVLFLNENPRVIQQIHKTLAHEGAHLFQSAKAKLASKADSWIHEGGAEVATIIVLSQAELISPQEVTAEIRTAFSLCSDYLKSNQLSNSIRNRSNAHYHCGQLIGLMTGAALKEHSYFEFWIEMTERNGVLSSRAYFETMLALNARTTIVEALRKITQDSIDKPKQFLSRLMLESGLSVTFDDQYELTEFQLP